MCNEIIAEAAKVGIGKDYLLKVLSSWNNSLNDVERIEMGDVSNVYVILKDGSFISVYMGMMA